MIFIYKIQLSTTSSDDFQKYKQRKKKINANVNLQTLIKTVYPITHTCTSNAMPSDAGCTCIMNLFLLHALTNLPLGKLLILCFNHMVITINMHAYGTLQHTGTPFNLQKQVHM